MLLNFQINLWTPRVNSSLPVLIWIPGGNFETIRPSNYNRNGTLIDGTWLAQEQQIIVVTVAYR